MVTEAKCPTCQSSVAVELLPQHRQWCRTEPARATCLYRLFDADDVLLYVGISKSGLMRLGQHLTEKPWASDVARTTIEWFTSRSEAAAAEVAAIVTEKPRHNVMHAGTSVSSPVGVQALCDECREPVTNKGYLVMYGQELAKAERSHWEYAQYERKFDRGGMILMSGNDLINAPATHTARWRCLHARCDPKNDTGDYALRVERPLSLDELDSHTRHLMEKVWFRVTDWPLFLLRLMRARGEVFRRECRHERVKLHHDGTGKCRDCGMWAVAG